MSQDRHGRIARVDNDRLRRPSDGFRAADARRFARIVADAMAALPAPLQLARVAQLSIRDVPDTSSGVYPTPHGGVPFAAYLPAKDPADSYLIVFRRPLEARATTQEELLQIVRSAIGHEVALALGIPADLGDDLDDDFEDDEDDFEDDEDDEEE